MSRTYIYETTEKLAKKHGTRDPFRLLSELGVTVLRSDRYRHLKGFCALFNRSYYIMINEKLPEDEQRIVAAHELGHFILHKKRLSLAPMQDTALYGMKQTEEYEANLFAADLLMTDEEILQRTEYENMDIFTLCRTLRVPPELMSFKTFSMITRGHRELRLPMDLESTFLAK